MTEGYKREIDLVGIGYKAEKKGKDVVFSVGFSHQVRFPMPEGIKIDVAPDAKAKDVTHIIVTGVDKQKVGQTATEIRGIQPARPVQAEGLPLRRRGPEEEGRQGDGQVRNGTMDKAQARRRSARRGSTSGSGGR